MAHWKAVCWAAIAVVLAMAPAAAAKGPWVQDNQLEFRLPDLDGNVVDSSEAFEGKVVLVDLWGTWCPPCLSEIPTLIELQERYAERGLVIVAIAFEGEEDAELRREYLREFATENDINYMILDGGPTDDFESALPGVHDVRGFPVEILIDRDGRVTDARNGYGFKKKWVRRLTADIESLLGP